MPHLFDPLHQYILTSRNTLNVRRGALFVVVEFVERLSISFSHTRRRGYPLRNPPCTLRERRAF